jgi:hypothetical protein
MHDESLEPRAYAKLHADRFGHVELERRAEFATERWDYWRRLSDTMSNTAFFAGLIAGVFGGLVIAFILGAARHAGWL